MKRTDSGPGQPRTSLRGSVRASRIFSVACVFLLASASSLAQPSGGRPNIIFIMSDDHAVPAVSAYGGGLNSTPNIDRLAKEGIRFDAAFVTNSICTPSRAVMLTGMHSHKNGVLGLGDTFDGGQPTVAKLLQRAGYHTGMIGKWHLKSEPAGFDEYAVLPGQGLYYNPVFRHKGNWPETARHDGYVTDVTTDLVLEFLEKRPTNKPFFLMYHHKAPHDVFVPKDEHRNLYADRIPEPPSLFEDVRGRIALRETTEVVGQKHLAYGDPVWRWFLERVGYRPGEIDDWEKELAGVKGRELKTAQYQIYMRRYLQCVHSIDENVGRVLDYLDRSRLAANTVVIYTSDQGFFLGEHGLYDKRLMYEPSFRIPLLVRWPAGVPAGSVNKQLIQNLDFAPTMLDLAGVAVPAEMQGRSFKKLAVSKDPQPWRDAIYYRYWMNRAHFNIPAHLGVRTERHKLIYFYDNDRGPDGRTLVLGAKPNVRDPFWELYDLEKDQQELDNVIADPARAEKASELLEKLIELRRRYGDNRDGLDLREAFEN